ncbi:hypothetical protein FRC11_001474, partial [Ceratobasidium sp. 423]
MLWLASNDHGMIKEPTPSEVALMMAKLAQSISDKLIAVDVLAVMGDSQSFLPLMFCHCTLCILVEHAAAFDPILDTFIGETTKFMAHNEAGGVALALALHAVTKTRMISHIKPALLIPGNKWNHLHAKFQSHPATGCTKPTELLLEILEAPAEHELVTNLSHLLQLPFFVEFDKAYCTHHAGHFSGKGVKEAGNPFQGFNKEDVIHDCTMWAEIGKGIQDTTKKNNFQHAALALISKPQLQALFDLQVKVLA